MLNEGENWTCTYADMLQLGAIKVTKLARGTGAPLAGATFTITGPKNVPNPTTWQVTTGPDGTACAPAPGQPTGLPFGTYTVTETVAPPGYDLTGATP
jgi:uncharacterized surface anchored protein